MRFTQGGASLNEDGLWRWSEQHRVQTASLHLASADYRTLNLRPVSQSGAQLPQTLAYLGASDVPGQYAYEDKLFYAHAKDKALNYKFLRISSGYRCWYDNVGYLNGRANAKTKCNSANHMGNALDLQFLRGTSNTRCQGTDVDLLREAVLSAMLPGCIPGVFLDGK